MSRPVKLRPSERRAVQLVSEGHSYKAVARLICKSHKTVEAYICHAKARNNCRTAIELCVRAVKFGVEDLKEDDAIQTPLNF